MLRHGIPRRRRARAARRCRARSAPGAAAATVTRPLADGEELALRDRTLRGPAPPRPLAVGHGLLGRGERRMLLGGDHLIKHISSNPLISRPARRPLAASPASGRPRALMTYLDSLRATREMPIDVVPRGHGEPVTDHVGADRRALRAARAARREDRGLIAERPRTAYEIAQALWGNVAVTQAYLTLSEVLGHVDLLLNRGGPASVRSAASCASRRRDGRDPDRPRLAAGVGGRARHGRAARPRPVPDRAGDRRPGAGPRASGRTTRSRSTRTSCS